MPPTRTQIKTTTHTLIVNAVLVRTYFPCKSLRHDFNSSHSSVLRICFKCLAALNSVHTEYSQPQSPFGLIRHKAYTCTWHPGISFSNHTCTASRICRLLYKGIPCIHETLVRCILPFEIAGKLADMCRGYATSCIVIGLVAGHCARKGGYRQSGIWKDASLGGILVSFSWARVLLQSTKGCLWQNSFEVPSGSSWKKRVSS